SPCSATAPSTNHASPKKPSHDQLGLDEGHRGTPPHTRELRDLQLRVRAEQQTPEWKTRYAVRFGVESTVNEFAHGHGIRRCRYRGQGKAHTQHILTAIAVNIERLSGLPPTEETPTLRQPTAFQHYLDQRDIPRPKSWRTLGS
ncbi:transposase, partial [Streptomyces sp. 8K308]|uniref:transposase n=1 Tax=Streptomyces sp. 8K308 TaxID=2530388 RepID=UPI001FB7F72F